MSRHDAQQDPRAAFGLPAPLLPVAESSDADTEQGGEFGLAQPVALPQAAHVRLVEAKLAGSRFLAAQNRAPLTNARQQLVEKLLLHGYSPSTTLRNASRCFAVRSDRSAFA